MKLNIKLIRVKDGKEFFPTNIQMNGFGHCNGEIQRIEAREKDSVGGEYEIIKFNFAINKQIKKFKEEYKVLFI
jgi:hypothetical protein